MKRPRNIGLPVILIVLTLGIFVFIGQSAWQNHQVQQHFNIFFRAVQVKDENLHIYFYPEASMPASYRTHLSKYPLLGWKITKIDGQPFPLDTPEFGPGGSIVYHKLYADMYYRLPDELMEPDGKYQRMKHPEYGECAVVPVALQFAYHARKVRPWIFGVPDFSTGENWVAPFEKLKLTPFD